ncbi:hypothetical protein GCM10010324_63770 [Streptomyces hiroshimensis]|uniref:Uncharacterized protein n=1 Tax=Streptomyces hiroshimensis TaxID=66424 RepID=A0ABQ2ZBI9_9ACTN|nr:hypothetical protein GCM10010324_63770 [Streptomyces hiroshimensis]
MSDPGCADSGRRPARAVRQGVHGRARAGPARAGTPADIRLPEEAKDRLAAIAAAEGLSLRTYLARLAETPLTPAERAEKARAVFTGVYGFRHGFREVDQRTVTVCARWPRLAWMAVRVQARSDRMLDMTT